MKVHLCVRDLVLIESSLKDRIEGLEDLLSRRNDDHLQITLKDLKAVLKKIQFSLNVL